MLKNYLSKLSIEVLKDSRITETEVNLPTKIDPVSFKKLMGDNINVGTLTPEKAIYIASREPRAKYKTAVQLLNSKLRF